MAEPEVFLDLSQDARTTRFRYHCSAGTMPWSKPEIERAIFHPNVELKRPLQHVAAGLRNLLQTEDLPFSLYYPGQECLHWRRQAGNPERRVSCHDFLIEVNHRNSAADIETVIKSHCSLPNSRCTWQDKALNFLLKDSPGCFWEPGGQWSDLSQLASRPASSWKLLACLTYQPAGANRILELPEPAGVFWLLAGAVVQREKLPLESSLHFALYLSAEDLEPDLSGFQFRGKARQEKLLSDALEKVLSPLQNWNALQHTAVDLAREDLLSSAVANTQSVFFGLFGGRRLDATRQQKSLVLALSDYLERLLLQQRRRLLSPSQTLSPAARFTRAAPEGASAFLPESGAQGEPVTT